MKYIPLVAAVIVLVGWVVGTVAVTVVTQAQAVQMELLRQLEK